MYYIEDFLNINKAVYFWSNESYFSTLHKRCLQNPLFEQNWQLPSFAHGTQATFSTAPTNSAKPCSKKMITVTEEWWTEAPLSKILPTLKLTDGFSVKITVNNKTSQSPSAYGSTNSEVDTMTLPLNISTKAPSPNILHH